MTSVETNFIVNSLLKVKRRGKLIVFPEVWTAHLRQSGFTFLFQSAKMADYITMNTLHLFKYQLLRLFSIPSIGQSMPTPLFPFHIQ